PRPHRCLWCRRLRRHARLKTLAIRTSADLQRTDRIAGKAETIGQVSGAAGEGSEYTGHDGDIAAVPLHSQSFHLNLVAFVGPLLQGSDFSRTGDVLPFVANTRIRREAGDEPIYVMVVLGGEIGAE